MTQVEQDHNILPVVRLIDTLSVNAANKLRIIEWVQHFSPFQFRERKEGKLSARMKKEGRFDLSAAKRTPYWVLGTPPTTPSKPLPSLAKDLKRDSIYHSKKAVLESVKAFLAAPSDSSLARLTEQLNEYLKYGITLKGVERNMSPKARYVRVVSGGLPSLGKNAK